MGTQQLQSLPIQPRGFPEASLAFVTDRDIRRPVKELFEVFMCGQSEVRWKMAWEMGTNLTNTVWPAVVTCLPFHGTNLAATLFSKGQKTLL
jgi:hypothetical protein